MLTKASPPSIAQHWNVWLSPRTTAGFALAGGGTSFSVANGLAAVSAAASARIDQVDSAVVCAGVSLRRIRGGGRQ